MTTRPFEAEVAEHGLVVLRVCRALLGPVDADDAWTDTFVSAMRAYPRLRPDSNVRGWLVTIAHRTAIDHLRARGRRAVPTSSLPDTTAALDDHAAALERADDATQLRAAIAALPDKQRLAVVARHLADLPYSEVAALLGGSEAAARRNVADAIASLRRSYLVDAGLPSTASPFREEP